MIEQSNIIGVIGKPRKGKTLFITMLGWFDLFGESIMKQEGDTFDKLFMMMLGYSPMNVSNRKIFGNYPIAYDYTAYNMDDILSIKAMLVDLEPKTFLMQEAGKWFDSRKSMSKENVDLINFTGQSGKRETKLYYDDQFITRIDKGLRDVTERTYVADCIRAPDNSPILFTYEEYSGYFLIPTGRTLKFPAFWMSKFYSMYDTRQPTIREEIAI